MHPKIPDNYLTMEASEALDYVSDDKNYTVVVAFSSQEDFMHSWKLVAKKCNLIGMKVVRVEPTEANALELQINKHPTYVLYRKGNEDWITVGNNNFIEKIDCLRP